MNGLQTLQQKFPWPATRPAVDPTNAGYDCGGREIVTAAIQREKARVVLEVGSFLGLSARTWLKASPKVTLICLDPWSQFGPEALKPWPELIGKSTYDLFLSSCWDERHRIVPVRMESPDGLFMVKHCGVTPDLIYLDGDHAYGSVMRDLTICHHLFPEAALTGDDWTWSRADFPPASVQEAVFEFAISKNWSVQCSKNTWLLIGSGKTSPLGRTRRSWWPGWRSKESAA